MRPDDTIQPTELETYCEQVYHRIGKAWNDTPSSFITKECKFSILYGPPIFMPDLMIIGTNPGYNPEDLYDAEIYRWPSENEYWAKDWVLAKKLRKFFLEAGIEPVLKSSVGTNFLFFKSRAIKTNGLGLCWEDNPKELRERIEKTCLIEVRGMVERIQPKIILVLGLGVFDKYCNSDQEIRSSSGRIIGKIGTFNGSNAIGIMHPTGARISNTDMAFLVDLVKKLILDKSGSALSSDNITQTKRSAPKKQMRNQDITLSQIQQTTYAFPNKTHISAEPSYSIKSMIWACVIISLLISLGLIVFGIHDVIFFFIVVFVCLLVVAGINPILFALDLLIIWVLWHLL